MRLAALACALALAGLAGAASTGDSKPLGARILVPPAWSPDGKRIAFVRSSGEAAALFVVDARGRRPRKLLDRVPIDRIEWSPDGRYLAVAWLGFPRGGGTIRVLSARGQLKWIASTGACRADFAWSPDGRRIAFTVCGHRGTPPATIFVANLDGSTRELARGWNPAWAPDATRIAFVRTTGSGACAVRVHTIRPDGTGERIITPARRPGDDGPSDLIPGNQASPTFSPDGKLVAAVEGSPCRASEPAAPGAFDQYEEPVLLNVDGSGETVLPASCCFAEQLRLAWSSRRELLAMTWRNLRGRYAETLLAVAARDPLGRFQVRELPVPASGDLAWSPDGRRLAFGSLRCRTPVCSFAVHVADFKFTEPFITTVAQRAAFPAWSPDGKRLLFVRPVCRASDPAGVDQLFTIRPDGTHAKQLTRCARRR